MCGGRAIQVSITLFILNAFLGMDASATQVVTAEGEILGRMQEAISDLEKVLKSK